MTRRGRELEGTIAAIGPQAGPLSQWLHRGPTEAGQDVGLMEAGQGKGALLADQDGSAAALCRPVKVSHAEGGFGGTLTLLASGAAAPMVQMQLPALRERINAAYGYAAIARIRITQTSERLAAAPSGLAEAPAPFAAATAGAGPVRPAGGDNFAAVSGGSLRRAQAVLGQLTEGVADTGLRDALERLAENVLGRQKAPGRKPGPH